MKLIDILNQATHVKFVRCENGALHYACVRTNHNMTSSWPEHFFEFPIPLVDTEGAVFRAQDSQPKHFMRWIRREVERIEAERARISEARAAWEAEQSACEWCQKGYVQLESMPPQHQVDGCLVRCVAE